MKRHAAVLLVSGTFLCAESYAQQIGRTTFKVSARVQAVCEMIASDLTIDHSTALSAGRPLGTAQLQATCTPNASCAPNRTGTPS